MPGSIDQERWFGWSGVLVGFCDLAAELGCDGAAILAGFGFDESCQRTPGYPVHTLSIFRAYAELAAQSGRSDVALRVVRHQRYEMLGSLGEAARRAPDLGRALVLMNTTIHTRATGYVPSLEFSGDTAIVRYRSLLAPGPLQDLQLDYNIASLVLAVRSLVGPDWNPEQVDLSRSRPPHAHEWTRYFRCPVRFNAEECLILFDSADLSRPLQSGNRASGAASTEVDVPIDFVQLVDREIIRNLGRGIADLPAVAQSLGVNPRTVQRRLVRAGTTYQQRLDEIRQLWARQYLASRHVPLTELAQVLGFADLSTFSRTFRRWFGVSPRTWRAAQAQQVSQ